MSSVVDGLACPACLCTVTTSRPAPIHREIAECLRSCINTLRPLRFAACGECSNGVPLRERLTIASHEHERVGPSVSARERFRLVALEQNRQLGHEVHVALSSATLERHEPSRLSFCRY